MQRLGQNINTGSKLSSSKDIEEYCAFNAKKWKL